MSLENRKMSIEKEFISFSIIEFNKRIEKSLNNIQNGKVISHKDLEKKFIRKNY